MGGIKIGKRPAGQQQHCGQAGRRISLQLISVREAAEYAKVSPATVRRWIKADQLKCYRVGKQLRIDEPDLVEFISSGELQWL